MLAFSHIAVLGQTTTFTYQGKLTDSSVGANGNYDMQFKLFDAAGAGVQQGPTITNPTVQATNGIFTVQLDFGSLPFALGADRYLDISLRPAGNTGAYTSLSPRQKITSAPYATRAAISGDSNLLGGQPPAAYGSASQITSLQTQNASLQAQINQLQSQLATTMSGSQLWSRSYGSLTNETGYSVAVDSIGNVFVTGSFTGTVYFGATYLTSVGGSDVFVAKYSGVTGAHMWSRRFGGTGDDSGMGIAVDPSGNVVVTGYFQATLDLGTLTSAGGNDIFLAKFAGSDGANLWVRRFGGPGNDGARSIAASGSGDIVITGNFNGAVDFGGGTLTSLGDDIFVAHYSGSAAPQWSRRFGGTSTDIGQSVAVDNDGNVVVTGLFLSGTIDFGGGSLTNAGSYDGFLAKLAGADGAHLWSKRFGGTSLDEGNSVAVDVSGSVFVTGTIQSLTIDFGGGPLPGAGGNDTFVVKYDPSGGHKWSRVVGTNSPELGTGISVDNNGNPIITGYFFGTSNFGGISQNSAGNADIFIARYAGNDGAYQWSKRFGGADDDEAYGIVTDGSGDIFLTGYFSSPSVDFGGGPLTNAGTGATFDIFLVKLKK